MPTAVAISDEMGRAAVDKYMAYKGYPGIAPVTVSRITDQPCWYFLYDLDDGEVEVEVSFDEGEWSFYPEWLG